MGNNFKTRVFIKTYSKMIHFLRKYDHIIPQDDSSFDKQSGDTFFLKTVKMVQHRKTHLPGMEIFRLMYYVIPPFGCVNQNWLSPESRLVNR